MIAVDRSGDVHMTGVHTSNAFGYFFPLFSDDFESGDTPAWSHTVP